MTYVETHRHKAFVDSTLAVVWSPTRCVLKQTDCPDATVCAEIEPVQRAARHANQIAGFDFDCQHWSTRRVNVEYPVTGDGEPHFVFVVPVLAIKLREHVTEPWCCWTNVNHVGRNVAASSLQFFNLACICMQNLFGWSIVR